MCKRQNRLERMNCGTRRLDPPKRASLLARRSINFNWRLKNTLFDCKLDVGGLRAEILASELKRIAERIIMRVKIALTLILVTATVSNVFAKTPAPIMSKHIVNPPPPLFPPHNINASNLSFVHSQRRVEIKRIQDILHQLRNCPPASP